MKHYQLHLVLLCGIFALQSCRDNPASPTSTTTPSLVMPELLALFSEGEERFAAPGSPDLPRDLGTNAEAGAESFSVQAILSLADGRDWSSDSIRSGVNVRLDRVALPLDYQVQPLDSAWRYNGIMRSSAFIDTNIARLEASVREAAGEAVFKQLTDLSVLDRTQSVQRVALDLAGLSETQMWVGNDRLTISGLDASSDSCARDYRWEVALSARDTLVLDFPMSACPRVSAFSTFNTWQQTSDEVNGVLLTDRAGAQTVRTPVKGVLWMSQSWGSLPRAGGAVAIDTLQIRLDDGRWLNVSRSKRRSGRGPETVTAVLRTGDSLPVTIDVTWQDSDEKVVTASGNGYPDSIELNSPDHDLVLTVRAMNRLSEVVEFDGRRLDIPVMVSGEKSGAGFLSFHGLTP